MIHSATKTAQAMKADPRFEKLVKQAHGIFIVPTMVKGGLLIGGKGGQGVSGRTSPAPSSGLNVSATDVTSNSQEDATFYGHHVTTQQILHGQVE